ncbi:nuclear transport factor 2 family protein [Chryseobacterium sp.]|uniref:nuclear transport factor 2 family protein n=1 Tax=Chryseobacterium sp. TaxID=1871047 RepID=UPI0025B7DA08|nr:nuclear transport factor 2 family protein [Chryseobacterium sp.]
MRKTILYILLFFLFGLTGVSAQLKGKFAKEKGEIHTMLNGFNVAAAKADYDTYFNYFAKESVFIGTDATEVWDKEAFRVWAKPFFDKKQTWNFTSLQRNIYFSKDGKMAWFDELLNTQMKLCRGSGVLEKINGEWKIRQYVLSMTVPNEVVDQVVSEKAPIEDVLIEKARDKRKTNTLK